MIEIEALEARRDNLVRLEEGERRMTGLQIGGAPADSFETAMREVRAVDVIRAQIGATDAAAGRARELSQEIERRSGRKAEGLYFPTRGRASAAERRALSLTNGNGAALVQTDVSPAWIDALRAKSLVYGLGATVLSDLAGNLAIPRVSATASVGWVADGTALTPSNETLDQVSFAPHHVGGIVGLSRSVIMQSSPDVAQLVENDLAALIGTAIDQAAIAGNGSNGVPLGILSTVGIGSVAGGTNGAAITWANIQALVGAVDGANALAGKLGFATNAKVVKSMRSTLRTAADTSSNFIIGDDPTSLAGFPLVNSNNVPSNGAKGTGSGLSAMIFGDWSSLVIAEWSALDILVNPFGASYSAGGVDVRAMASVDIGLRHAPAFAAITDIVAP